MTSGAHDTKAGKAQMATKKKILIAFDSKASPMLRPATIEKPLAATALRQAMHLPKPNERDA